MSPFGWDYPAGAEHDPRAPWNQEDADDCPECDGTGQVNDSDGPDECQVCGGSGRGETLSERRMRLLEDKADRDLDAAKDRE